jgi:hypothetical protein
MPAIVQAGVLDSSLLVGQKESFLCSAETAALLGAPVHAEIVEPFRLLREDGVREGFDIQILSGFRSVQRQLSIWNRKAVGELPVLDSAARPLDIGRLDEKQLAFAILRWSALPGASRHHWGTDLDVFDAAAKPEGYEIELIPEEVSPGGMFGPLHDWLDERIGASGAHGFFRPYDLDRDGVAPERWHLSHAPVASTFEREFTVVLLSDLIGGADIELKEVILEHMDEIYDRFVINIGRPPP